MGVSFSVGGSTKNTERFLASMKRFNPLRTLERYGRQGVAALAAATPVDSGLSSESWGYEVFKKKDSFSIVWTNSNTVNGTPVVIWLQYGHGTGTGGWVQGYDFINPAVRPIFDEIANGVWKAVTSA